MAGTGGQRPLTVTKIHTLLARQGCVVPYRTLHRFASERCGFGRKDLTVRVADGDPGVECQVDFGYLGMLTDADDGRRRKVHALIFTAVYSRHMFVWLSYSQTLTAVIAGCEAAWEFFGGVFAVLIPDNLKPVIADADAVNPQFTHGWLDYAGHAGFLTDPRGWPHRRTSRGWNGPCNMCAETSGTVKHSPVSRPRSSRCGLVS
ncbi:hypothetical protein MAGR_14170 [Mycolicibacterium agri]|uniref:Integrase catalytic domain-containing protein n=2 Tax=Mycolicibacterium agri TaxID=36811 RepID=A0A7I9VYC1_MYCAG|nr:hypothetical protein MAGR_14170 [Mycolicibacterium agri]